MPVQRVLMMTSDFYGYHSHGGLGNAVYGLANALSKKGIEVIVAVPAMYKELSRNQSQFNQVIKPNSKIRLIEVLSDFSALRPYKYGLREQQGTEAVYRSGVAFGFKVHELIQYLSPDSIPDIVHLHDWHAAAAAWRISGGRIPTVLTVHNAMYDGPVPWKHLTVENLPHQNAIKVGNEFYHSLLELGVDLAIRTNTVSQQYAQELLAGQNVDPRIQRRLKEKGVIGILNGIDAETNDPQHPNNAAPFDPRDANYLAAGKSYNKAILHNWLGFEPNSRLHVTIIGRMVQQKGIDLGAA